MWALQAMVSMSGCWQYPAKDAWFWRSRWPLASKSQELPWGRCRGAPASAQPFTCLSRQADLLLLSSSEPHGLCYIETAELDG